MARKTYWQSMVSDSDRAKEAIRSWFAPLADGMMPERAEVLCDLATDAERKLRVYMTAEDGQRYEYVRAKTVRGFTITIKRLAEAS